MKYCRFDFEGHAHYGTVEVRGGEFWIVDLATAPEEDLAYRLAHARATSWSFDFEPMPLSAARLLPPVTPSKIVCVGRNYRDHAKELGNEVPAEPLLFFKPTSSLLAPGGVVRMPPHPSAWISKASWRWSSADARANLKPMPTWRGYVRGYTLANDVTARDLQKKDGQWTRAKGFDTFCPVGPLVSDEIDPAAGLTLETRVNGEFGSRIDQGFHLSDS